MESIQQYIKEQKTLLEQTLREMALIKAPTGHEKKKAEYCVEWLQAAGNRRSTVRRMHKCDRAMEYPIWKE